MKKFAEIGRFSDIDQDMLDLQEKLCAAKLTHRADQVDILRRALSNVRQLIEGNKS